MSEESLLKIASWLYFSSLVGSVISTVFSLFTARGIRKRFYIILCSVIPIVTVSFVILTLYVALMYGGCFESCSGKTEDEIGYIIAGCLNWCLSILLFFVGYRVFSMNKAIKDKNTKNTIQVIQRSD